MGQLYVEDIITVDGILCLNITDKQSDQHLKNFSSKRTLPIHPDIANNFNNYLIIISLLYVLPMIYYTKDNRYAGMSSKWFGRFRKKIGLGMTLPEKTFHSTRHTLAKNMLDQGVDQRVIDELLGHAIPGETGRYTVKRTITQLLKSTFSLMF